MKSLQSRLHLGLAGSLVVLMLLMGWSVKLGMGKIAREMMFSRLEHDAQTLLAAVQMSPQGQPELKNPRLGGIYNQVFSGHYYVVNLGETTLRSRSLWDYSLALPVGSMVSQISGPDGQELLVWAKGYERFGVPVFIAVAEDLTPLQAALDKFNLLFMMGVVVMVLLLLLVQGTIVRRSLAPLKKVQTQVQALATGKISKLSREVPAEIRPLVEEVNYLLELLAKQLQRSRNAVGNLAHELKHPLALLVQLEDHEVIRQHPELLQEIKSHTQQIRQITERELKRARLSGGGAPGQRFVPGEELPSLIEVLEKVYSARHLDIHCSFPDDAEYVVDRNDMLELLGNLLDNACKWARKKVVIKLWFDEGLNICVEDDGPGCNENQKTLLLERGVRMDEHTQGSGLGLSIVQEIVSLHQGEIILADSPLGGLSVQVRLGVGERDMT